MTSAITPATTFEVKLAAYLMIVATFDVFAPEGPYETAPSLLNYFLEEVTDGSATDSSSDTAMKLDAMGCSPYYINPVNKIM